MKKTMSRIELEYRSKKYFKSDGKWYSHLGERKPEMDKDLNRELSIIQDAKLWVGEIEGDIVVFDGELSNSDTDATFWMLSTDRFINLNRKIARSSAKKLDGKDRNLAIEKHRLSVLVRHRLRFHRMGKKYSGIRKSNKQVTRETYCWSCKKTLTSEGFPECVECGWILCECGSCGCGRR